jgi:serine/threonine protein kinase
MLWGPHVRAGTLRYMSPEQRQGRPADARSDVWMAGATIAEVLGPERVASGLAGEGKR